jgi:hypothetical protein
MTWAADPSLISAQLDIILDDKSLQTFTPPLHERGRWLPHNTMILITAASHYDLHSASHRSANSALAFKLTTMKNCSGNFPCFLKHLHLHQHTMRIPPLPLVLRFSLYLECHIVKGAMSFDPRSHGPRYSILLARCSPTASARRDEPTGRPVPLSSVPHSPRTPHSRP